MVARKAKTKSAQRGQPRAKKTTRTPAPVAIPEVEPGRGTDDIDLGAALADAYRTNERVSQLLLDMVEPRVWRVFPMSSSRRNIATSFAHIHNVRCMRIRASDPSLAPERLDRASVTQDEVRLALGASARAMVALIEASVGRGGRVRGYPRDIVLMTCVAIVHEAHHRGQICHWLRELGTPLSPEKQLILWEWDKRWKEIRR